MLDSTNILQHFEPQSGIILGRILGAKIAPKPLQLLQKNNTKNSQNRSMPRFSRMATWGGVPLEQQTRAHWKDGRVTPCVAYGTVADNCMLAPMPHVMEVRGARHGETNQSIRFLFKHKTRFP